MPRQLLVDEAGDVVALRLGGRRSARHRRAGRALRGRSRGATTALRSSAQQGDQPQENENVISKGLAFLSGAISALFALINGSQGKASSTGTARIVQQLGSSPVDAQSDLPLYCLGPFPQCTEASDLRRPRHFTVVTTAALPWTTGPAVNPLLRCLHLAKRGHTVVLLLPWVEREDQKQLFPEGELFDTKEEQEEYILRWCATRAGMDASKLPLRLQWYDARYVEGVRSIFPNGDLSQQLGDGPCDVLILEEPEHLCWYHEGGRWPQLFAHVIGVVHTNYDAYLKAMTYEGLLSAPAVRDSLFFSFTSLVCSAYCDVTVKLSGAGVYLPNEVVCNIHGVRDEFMEVGRHAGKRSRGSDQSSSSSSGKAKAYFLGKAVFQKGWGELLSLLEEAGHSCAELTFDGFGSGPDWEAISERADRLAKSGGAQLKVATGLDHGDDTFHDYPVLVNPSTTDMLCTVTAEALAMGKRCVLARHVSNAVFEEHFSDRCHFFDPRDVAGFERSLRKALAAKWPGPLSDEQQQMLSWSAAVDRLIDVAEVRVLSGTLSRPSDVQSSQLAYDLHQGIQTTTPAIGDYLKDVTLRESSSSAASTPWEQYLNRWRQTNTGRSLFGKVENYMTELKQGASEQQEKLLEMLQGGV